MSLSSTGYEAAEGSWAGSAEFVILIGKNADSWKMSVHITASSAPAT